MLNLPVHLLSNLSSNLFSKLYKNHICFLCKVDNLTTSANKIKEDLKETEVKITRAQSQEINFSYKNNGLHQRIVTFNNSLLRQRCLKNI